MLLEPGHWSHRAYTPSPSSWVTGYGVRGLASPHPFLGAILLVVEARVVLASAVFFLVQFVVGDMEWAWLLLVAGWRTWYLERRLLAAVVDVSVIMQLKFQ